MDLVWPNGVRISSCDWRPISNTEVFPAPLSGGLQTVVRPGDRMACRVRVNNSSGAERAKLRALVHALRGRGNRCYLPDFAFQRRGSFPAPELFTNADFSSGTTGWSADFGTMGVSDGVMRLTASQGGGSNTQFRQDVTLTQYAPHVLRSVVIDGSQSAGLSIGPSLTLGAVSSNDYSATRGYRLASGTVISATSLTQFPCVFSTITGFTAGAYVTIPFVSMSRCFLADGGGTLTVRSREIDNASWTKNQLAAIGANTETAPDGTLTAEGITPNTTNAVHFVSQTMAVTSGAQDLNIRGYFKGSGYNFIILAITENTGSTQSYQVFNLGTGALGTATSTGANFSNLRASIKNVGNNWYYCSLVVRKTNAATSITGFAYVSNADSGAAFAGDGTSFIRAWDINLSPSSAHARTTASTSAAVSAESQSGSGIYVKGLPASTSGLLSQGDTVEIDKILYPLAADLDSDAAGLGYLQLAFPPPRAIADNTPIIVNRPMGKMILMNDPEIPCVPGGFSDFEFDFVQDLAA